MILTASGSLKPKNSVFRSSAFLLLLGPAAPLCKSSFIARLEGIGPQLGRLEGQVGRSFGGTGIGLAFVKEAC